jgi:hypothetical protein
LEKEETNEAEREKKRKDERKVLTLTGLLMEGVEGSEQRCARWLHPQRQVRELSLAESCMNK